MDDPTDPKDNNIEAERIRWAYRLIFDREPENQSAIDVRLGLFDNTKALRAHFLSSPEYIQNQEEPPIADNLRLKPPLEIETEIPPEVFETMMLHTQKKWEKLGVERPHWSVLTNEKFTRNSIESSKNTREDFYESGRMDVKIILLAFERNGVDPAALKSCIDFGCGLGRVTRWLCEEFDNVIGCDISKPHLESAKSYIESENISNATFLPVQKADDIKALPKVDLLFSLIVLQHNPPPIMAAILKTLLQRIKPNGIGYFQIPVYLDNYTFRYEDYLEKLDEQDEIEMHILPQSKAYEIVEKCGCRVLEVASTSSTGGLNGLLSYAFLVRKVS